MYFPYLRTKLNEMKALIELKDVLSANADKISPILEPCNLNSCTIKTLQTLSTISIPHILISNPQVGDLINNNIEIKNYISNQPVDNLIIGFIITSSTTIRDIRNFITTYSKYKLALLHQESFHDLNNLKLLIDKNTSIKYNVFFTDAINYNSNFPQNTAVILKDFFKKASKNSAYPSDAFFSDLYRNYTNNYVGFGDYQIVGDNFSDNGGPAHAIAIHLTYLSKQDILIKHFLSDDTKGTKNPDIKYLQALVHLITFISQPIFQPSNPITLGIKEFQSNYVKNHYPGLGMVKRYSIMHHIELILNVI